MEQVKKSKAQVAKSSSKLRRFKERLVLAFMFRVFAQCETPPTLLLNAFMTQHLFLLFQNWSPL